MKKSILLDTRIDSSLSKYQEMLANLQGNILKSHGRDLAFHIFLRFSADRIAVSEWIAEFAVETPVTSASKQQAQSTQHGLSNSGSELFCSFLLTASGYTKLGFGQDLSKFTNGATFARGMQAAGIALNDPPLQDWENHYHKTIDAMILLANDVSSKDDLEEAVAKVKASVGKIAEVVTTEYGTVLRKGKEPIEHFGYRDGISQPLFFKSDIDQEREQQGGLDQWDPTAPLNLVLVEDPLAATADCFGSYMVFRKLEQDVRGFKQAEKKLAETLDLEGSARERAGAMVIGRFENGSPLVLSETDSKPDFNNFSYTNDDQGHKCPFRAHIRKTNPRGENKQRESFDKELQHRIVRRGIPYGTRLKLPDDDSQSFDEMPNEGVGLLFMCFQSNIENQFEVIQRLWANNPQFVNEHAGIGVDPLIGQQVQNTQADMQKWSPSWNSAESIEFRFEHFVKLKGGEYFFSPSIPFLKDLNRLVRSR